MLQKNEMSKLQSLLAIYQLQTASGMVEEYYTEWKLTPILKGLYEEQFSDDDKCSYCLSEGGDVCNAYCDRCCDIMKCICPILSCLTCGIIDCAT